MLQCLLKGSRLPYQKFQNDSILRRSKTCPFSTFKEIKMAENKNQEFELQAMLPDGQGTEDVLSAPVSSQQGSESIVVTIEEVDEGNSCSLR